MPIKERNELTERLKRNWRIEKGHYIAIIDDVNERLLEDGRMPICWELTLVEKGKQIEKMHWIDKEGGVNLLVNDLRALGEKVSPETAIRVCNGMIGSRILISISYNGEHQNVLFLRKID